MAQLLNSIGVLSNQQPLFSCLIFLTYLEIAGKNDGQRRVSKLFTIKVGFSGGVHFSKRFSDRHVAYNVKQTR